MIHVAKCFKNCPTAGQTENMHFPLFYGPPCNIKSMAFISSHHVPLSMQHSQCTSSQIRMHSLYTMVHK